MVNVYLNSRKTNALMDTGAGVSVMDMGSLLQVAFRNRGVYAAHCCVTPDINGTFVVQVLNTNAHDVV